MSTESNFKLFETKHVMRILVYLLLNGPKSKTDIYRSVSTNPRMSDRLDMMEDRGLLMSSVQKDGTRRTVYRLTPKGESCAMLVCRMEEESGISMSEIMSGFLKRGSPMIRNARARRLSRTSCCR